MNRISRVGKLASLATASVVIAVLASPLFAQTAPAFLPNTAVPVAGYAGASGTATAYNGSQVSCTTAVTLGGSCTTWAAAATQGSNSAGTWYNSTYNGDLTPLTTELFFPSSLGYDPWGNLYWADRDLSLIREIPAAAPNTVVTVIGTASTIFSSTSYSLLDCTSLTTSAPSTSATGCLQGNIAKGDTTPSGFSAISAQGSGLSFGMYVDSWGNVILGDGNHIRIIYGQATNKSGVTNPFAAYLGSLYFGSISGTTVTVGAKYLSQACIDNATGNSGNPCNSSSRFTGVSAPITGNVYMLAGKYLSSSAPGYLTSQTGGGSPGLNNDYAQVSVANTVAGSQYTAGTNNMVEGNFPLMVTMGDGIFSVGEDNSGNVYFVDAGTRTIRVINVGSTAISVAGVNVDAYSVGTVFGAVGVTGQPGNAGSNCTYSALAGSSSDDCTGIAQTVTTAPNYTGIGTSSLSPLATSAAGFQLMGAVSVYVDPWGNIYIGQSGTAVTDGNSKGIYVVYAGAPNATTGSGNPLSNTLGILYGSSNVVQNDVYLLAGNGLSTRTVYYQWIPAAAGYGNTTSASGFSQPGYMVTDAAGNLYFSDQSGDHSVYRLDAASAHISLIAGFNASYAVPAAYSTASSSAPVACAVLNSGTTAAITGTNTSASAINPFGDGCSTYGISTGIPDGIGIDPSGDVVFADGGFNVIQALVAGNVFGSTASPLSANTTQYLHVHFYGNNLPSSLTTPYTGDFTITGGGASAFALGTPICSQNTKDVSMTASSTNGAYTGGSYDCYLPVTYKASTFGSTTATLTAVTSSGVNSTIPLAGYASGAGLLTATVSISAPATATPTQTVTVTVTVSGTGATPTGTVTLTATPAGGSATTLLNALNLTNGSIAYTGQLPAGTDSLVASYSGDLNYNSTTSNPTTTTVANLATSTTLTSSTGSIVPGQTVLLTATVASGSGGTPTGTVTFTSTSTGQSQGNLATATLVNGVATYYGLIWVGTDSVTANYSGDANYAVSTSNAVTVVNAAVTGKLAFNWPFLNWGQSVAYGASTSAWPVTLQNLSGVSVAAPSISLSGAGAANFTITGNACTSVLPVGATCMFNVVFSPTTGGSAFGSTTSATLTASTSTSSNYTVTLPVSGIALSNSLVFNWPKVTFPAQITGTTGTNPWPVVVTNLTGQTLTGVTYTLTGVSNYQAGAFTLANTCSTVAAGSSCIFNIAPTPLSSQSGGAYSASLVVSGTGGSTPYSSPALTVSGSVITGGYTINWNQDQQLASDGSGKTYPTIDFGPENAASVASGPWPITIYNNTAAVETLTLTPSLSVFTVLNSTCTSVPVGGSCTFNLYFTPTALQVYRGTLLISGGGYSTTINTWGQATLTPGGTGQVMAGQNPVSGAQVYLLAAATSGYGSASTSLIKSGSSGSTAIGQYTLTGATGLFSLVGDYTCTPGAEIYVLAVGGNPGLGQGLSNPALELMNTLGPCPASGYFTSAQKSVTVNEVTTVATAYALAGFMTDGSHLSSSATTPASNGVANAFTTVSNLININAGTANSVSSGNGAVPQAEIDTLADILVSCTQTTGSVVASPATPCYNLFNATNTGTMPTNTVQAILNIAHSPANNVSTLFQLAGNATYTPTLNSAPNDWTIGITYSSNSFGQQPISIAVDGSGNIWEVAQDLNAVNELNNQGVPASASPFLGFSLPTQVALDSLGNAWVTNSVPYGPTLTNLGISEILANGSAINNYTTGGVTLPLGVAIDASNNVWTANQITGGGNVSHITNAGAAFTGNVGPFGSTEETGVANLAIDPSGNVWTTTFYNTLNKLNGTTGVLGYTNTFSTLTLGPLAIDSSGTVWIADPVDGIVAVNGSTGNQLTGSPFTAGGVQNASSIALDGANNVWVASYQPLTYGCTGYVSGLTATGATITSSTGYTTPTLNTQTGGCVYSLAVDNSGNIWVAGPQTITQFVGTATPVQTPITPTALAVHP